MATITDNLNIDSFYGDNPPCGGYDDDPQDITADEQEQEDEFDRETAMDDERWDSRCEAD